MSDIKHEVVQALKKLASDLGRIPKRDDTRKAGIESLVRSVFGGHAVAITAAGLDQKNQKKIKPAEILKTDIQAHLNKHQSKAVAHPTRKTVAVLGDLHFPFESQEALSTVYSILDELKPDAVVQIGDIADMFAHSRFPASRMTFNPYEELELYRQKASEMFKVIRGIVSKRCELFLLLGNHDLRPIKRVHELYPAGEVFFEFKKWFEFPGVCLQEDPREPLIIDDVAYIHGYLSRLGSHRDHLQMNTVCGHSHKGGVSFKPYGNRILWELNVGYLGDETQKTAFGYTPVKTTHWTLGMGVVDSAGPRFIPFDRE